MVCGTTSTLYTPHYLVFRLNSLPKKQIISTPQDVQQSLWPSSQNEKLAWKVNGEVEVDVDLPLAWNRPHHSAMLLLHFSKDFVPTVRCGVPIDVQQNSQLSFPLFWGRLFLSVGVPGKGREGRKTWHPPRRAPGNLAYEKGE